MKKNNLENLEIKLQIAKKENFEAFEKFEKLYKNEYKDFLETFFKEDILGAKRIISASFQLNLLNGKDKNESLKTAVELAINSIPLSLERKKILIKKLLKLEKNKNLIKENILQNSDIKKDKNFPIIESLLERKILDKTDFILISQEFKKTHNIKKSIELLDKFKKEIIKEYLYLANSPKKEEKISSFKSEFSSELKIIQKKYPSSIVNGVVKFVGRNFFKMKPYKKNLESRKLRLRRTFKIALLRLLRIKYSGFNVEKLIRKIDSMQDFESMFRLIMKLIDIIPENNELLEKFSLQEDVDEATENITEAEKNKEKILSGEEATIKISKLLDKADKKIDKKLLDKILDDDVDLIGDELKSRKKKNILDKGSLTNGTNLLDGGNIGVNAGIFKEDDLIEEDEDNEEEEDFEELSQADLEMIYNEIKLDFSILDREKLNFLINDDFENLEKTIDKLAKIQIKLEKIEKLLV